MSEAADGLTPEQQAVVQASAHAVQVAAGPGTGKTHTLAHVVRRLIAEGLRPERIAVLTFTRDATAVLNRRLNALLGKGHLVQVSSFHSFCARLLPAGERRFFDRPEARALAERLAREALAHPTMGRKLQRGLGAASEDEEGDAASRLLGFISYCKNVEVSVQQAVQQQFPTLSGCEDVLARAYDAYEEGKGDRLDFDDLLLIVRDRLASDPRFRDQVAAGLDALVVDEYQDVNRSQNEIVRLLTDPSPGKHRPRAVVVGDVRQAIYGFRGGSPLHLKGFAEAQGLGRRERLALTLNFRSQRALLAAANRLFPEEDALDAPQGTPEGTPPEIVPCADPEAEARFLCDRITELLAAGEDPAEIVVLARARHLREAFDLEVAARVGDGVFLQANRGEAAETADLFLAFAQLVHPDYALGPDSKKVLGMLLSALTDASARDVVRFMDEALAVKAGGAKKAPEPKVVRDAFVMLRDRRAALGKAFHARADFPVREVAQAFGSLNWKGMPARIRAVRVLSRRLAALPAVKDLAELQAATLAALKPDHPETRLPEIVRHTIHGAKGLEWDHVFLLGAREGGLPSDPTLKAPDQYRDGLIEEEKRLFYVAVTRARKHLVITYPGKEGRRSFEPSRFLKPYSP